MKYTQVSSTAFEKLQLNAGLLMTSFTPSSATAANIFAATSGGVTFASNPQYVDFGEDIDNVPANTKQLKKIDHYEPRMSGTAKTIDSDTVAYLEAASTKTTASGVDKFVPRHDIAATDFHDLWWVGDYTQYNGATNGGFIAIKLINALNTGGFQVKSNDDGKGDFSFDFLGHYDISSPDTPPFEIYVKAGSAESSSSGGGTGGTTG